MEVSIFEVVGPIMIGPSSSHTAGAVKLARAARIIAKEKIKKVSFGLHGSFAKTYKGHGTDRALLAGMLGYCESDECIAQAFELAKDSGLEYEFYETELENVHENTVKITMQLESDTTKEVIGSSIGGGQILIHSIDGFEVNVSLQSPTLIISQNDEKGIVTEVARVMAQHNLNIANMRLIRKAKKETACCVIETDVEIPSMIEGLVSNITNIISAKVINV